MEGTENTGVRFVKRDEEQHGIRTIEPVYTPTYHLQKKKKNRRGTCGNA